MTTDTSQDPRTGQTPAPCAPTRRRALALGCAAAGVPASAALLAACGSSSTPDATPATAATSATASAASGTTVVALADVPVGGAVAVEVDGAQYLVSQPSEGTVEAFSAICPHQGCTVQPADGELDCPCHGSRFDLASGAVLQGPAQTGLAPLAVAVDGADVVLA